MKLKIKINKRFKTKYIAIKKKGLILIQSTNDYTYLDFCNSNEFSRRRVRKKREKEKHVIGAQLLISEDRCCTTIKGATRCF
jgi:hypothetical protein